MNKLKRIAVILEGRVQYERNVLRGIHDFATARPDWIIRLELPGHGTMQFLKSWKPHGVLYQSADLPRNLVKEIGAMPNAVHLSESPPRLGLRSVGLDNEAIGRAAANYYLERRCRHFAFVGTEGYGFSDRRGESFRKRLLETGHDASIFKLSEETSESDILKHLRSLPRPLALFSTHDECSLYLTTVCRSAGIRMPEDIAILGVDDDTLICELASPRLSSIGVPSRQVGFEASALLDRILNRRPDAGGSLLLPPTGIVTRHSTELYRTEDEIVNRALQVIHSQIEHGINVDDVIRQVGTSRRLLERKFSKQLGRTPHREIQRLRLERAKHLLLESDATLEEVALRCGCRDASRLVAMFRKETGMTPGRFRKESMKGFGGNGG